MISPPEKDRGYWTSEGQYETAEEWRENAEEHEGSWWEDWRGWLEQRSGAERSARMGSDQYPPNRTPGHLVREMHGDEWRVGCVGYSETSQGTTGKEWTNRVQRNSKGGSDRESMDESSTRETRGPFTCTSSISRLRPSRRMNDTKHQGRGSATPVLSMLSGPPSFRTRCPTIGRHSSSLSFATSRSRVARGGGLQNRSPTCSQESRRGLAGTPRASRRAASAAVLITSSGSSRRSERRPRVRRVSGRP